jgi:hypothetical protein
VANLQYHCKVLTQKLKRTNQKYLKCLAKLNDLEEEKRKNSKNMNLINNIVQNAENADEKAIFLMDLINNYSKKVPRWSEISVRMCTVWRFCSAKGYRFCHNNLTKLPSKSTILRHLGKFNGQNILIKERLCAEVSQFRHPIERICSVVIDDMSIKEKMHYSRSEDYVYGLDTCSSGTIGERPKIASKMLCYVVHGLSTQFTIPAGYFFHSTLTAKDFHSITLRVLQLLTDCNFIVLRLVTDNFSGNVGLFKKLGNGSLQNSIQHPILPHIPLFLSFDFVHVLKNARSIFLDHDMGSSEGIISAKYLKFLFELQQGLPVKPVKYLTKKHLFPTRFEKMNVRRAIQVFSPSVTAALRFLKEAGDEQFSDVDATISYMENMYHFFKVHNVSRRYQYTNTLDSSEAPFVHISDERLHWLNTTFQKYIADIQQSSATLNLNGLTKETSHALTFTAKSTYLCIKYLLNEVGFYYVLTRSFSSDCVEAMFSHVRLKGGSNDATDARAAEYAMRQILRCGIIKASTSANVSANEGFISSTTLPSLPAIELTIMENVLLPFVLRRIQNLKYNTTPDNHIYAASVAFLAGYICKKINTKIGCDACITPLLSFTVPGPLLQLVSLQDRGGLFYPSSIFVAVVQRIADIGQEALQFMEMQNTCHQMVEIMRPHLLKNPIFSSCLLHKNQICELIITATLKPVLDNICQEKTDLLKKKCAIQNKPLCRKILKL